MSRFKALTLGLVEEGRFEAEIDVAMAHLQAELIRFVQQHGPEKAKGAKAKLTVGITMQFEGPNKEDFSVKGTLQQSVPSRPAVVTRAMADLDDEGLPVFFVRASGSTADSPTQGVLTTDDGRVVDTATGEVLDNKKSATRL
jgi:hypothetical protein